MLSYLLRRILNYAIMLVIATSLGYLLAATFMDPTLLWDFTNAKLDRDAVMRSLTSRNLNPHTPVFHRYINWLQQVVFHWDWGVTPKGESINTLVATRIGVSIRFILLGSMVGMVGGVALGAWNATRQYKFSDRLSTLFSLIVLSTPVMVLITFIQFGAVSFNNLIGVQFFAFVGAHGTPGNYPGAYIVDTIQHLLLPTVSMSLGGIAAYSRYQRNMMLDTLGADYVRTARAKGLRQKKAVFRHALRTSLVPMATYFAFTVAGLFLGATVTEQLYSWNGLGIYSVSAIQQQDINGTAAVVAFSGLATLSGAFLSDILTVLVDPRVRVS